MPSEISFIGHRVGEIGRLLGTERAALESALGQLDWHGDAADAAKSALHVALAQYQDATRRLELISRCISDAADDMYPICGVVRECESFGVAEAFTIDADGVVSDGLASYTTSSEDAWDAARTRMRHRRDLEERILGVVRRATWVDENVADDLRRIGESSPNEETTPAAGTTATAQTGWAGSASSNAAFWSALPRSEQTALLVHDPGFVGNLDGLPAGVRDAANRRALVLERSRLEGVAEDLGRRLERNALGGLLDNADAGLEQTRKRLKALDAIESVLLEGNRQLLVLDNSSADNTLAAIAAGNVDTATHVAVFVPGLDSEVGDDIGRYDEDIDSLRRTVQQLVPKDESVACVTWMDYQAPQLGWDLLDPRRTVLSPMAAAIGAPRLTGFLDGLDASRSADPHLTLLGHSYGSLTAALAVRGLDETGVDEFVALGSPGLGFDEIDRLSIPPGHLFVGETRGDLVADAGLFGTDPSELEGVRPLGTRSEGNYADSHGHSEYLTDGTVTQRNVALVVAGRADEVS